MSEQSTAGDGADESREPTQTEKQTSTTAGAGGSGMGNVARALNVPRNAALGFGIGSAVAVVLLFGVFVGPEGQFPPVYYVGLGFVLATGVGLLLTVAFSLRSAYRLARSL